MTQRSGFFTVLKLAGATAVAACCLVALAFLLATPEAASAAGPDRKPNINAVPTPRTIPPPRLPPTPRVLPRKVEPTVPNARFGPGPGVMRPNIYSPNCRSNCGSRCQMISCADLNVSQCLSERQRCRISCSSRC